MFSFANNLRKTAVHATQTRAMASTPQKYHGFNQFFANATYTRTGRAWSAPELRVKSQEDLEKLWFVLLKERNALSTYQHYCRQNRRPMPNKERIDKCLDSMKAIKVVLGERRHAYKEVVGDKDFLAARTVAREQRQLDRAAVRADNAAPKTANQVGNVTVQAKKWRRKTMGQGLKPVVKQATVV